MRAIVLLSCLLAVAGCAGSSSSPAVQEPMAPPASTPDASGGSDFGDGGLVAIDASGSVLVVVNDNSHKWARWLDDKGAPLGDTFEWNPEAVTALRLPEGGFALRRWIGTYEWFASILPGSTELQAPPAWLIGLSAPLRFTANGRGLAYQIDSPSRESTTSKLEVRSRSGKVCASIEVDGVSISVGADGTLISGDLQKTFRVYPRLLQ